MERLIERISSRIGFVSNLTFEKNILHYKHGVTSNKILNQDQRFMNVRDHLEVAEPAKIVKNEVMVLDDVVTSGATLYYAGRYLRESGAVNVHCVALTQTIS
jgi:predicted amidophosphoribosyltransferase